MHAGRYSSVIKLFVAGGRMGGKERKKERKKKAKKLPPEAETCRIIIFQHKKNLELILTNLVQAPCMFRRKANINRTTLTSP